MGQDADAYIGYGIEVPRSVKIDFYDLVGTSKRMLRDQHDIEDRFCYREHKDYQSRRDFGGDYEEWQKHQERIKQKHAEETEEGQRLAEYERDWRENYGIECVCGGSLSGYADQIDEGLVAEEALIRGDWSSPTPFDNLPEAPEPEEFIRRLDNMMSLHGMEIKFNSDPCWFLFVGFG